ncbi:MAG: hypothetical protein LAP87_02650 [Acidobacteriia bacterium]|nr:hypothetical protein [Terriglobia bacterium]
MAHNIEHLLPGDILIGAEHTMIYIGGNHMVHAMPQTGLTRANMVDGRSYGIWDGAWAYRARSATLRDLAADYASSWAPSAFGRTAYSRDSSKKVVDNRGSGVKEQMRLGIPAPFGYDAFYRSFKWALRYDGQFSAERGTTCCAVLIAAYHAASVFTWTLGDTPEERLDRIGKVYDFLSRHRGPKNEPELVKLTSDLKDLTSRAFPRTSNRGQDVGSGRMEFGNLSAEILEALAGEAVTLEDVYTRALLVDAKFTHTTVLQKRLTDHTGAWEPKVIQLEYQGEQDPHAGLSSFERMMRGMTL